MTVPSMPDRPDLPPPGSPRPEELLVARFRPQARTLTWSALALIIVCGAAGYGWDNLPGGFGNWVVVAAAAGLILLLVVVPWLVWRSRVYTLTTRRVIARRGVFGQHSVEVTHASGYTVETSRSVWQRMWGTGTLTLSVGAGGPDDGDEAGRVVLTKVPRPRLVAEALADQVEINQILDHREAETAAYAAAPGE